jgi:4-amino-4-deoxy-L-arabinose transferase-like glycosyltransferase
LITITEKIKQYRNLWILAGIWLLGALSDRFWAILDHNIPSWDEADYINGALLYWQGIQAAEWWSGEWWRSFWLLSNKIPPLIYILTTPFLEFLHPSIDNATLILTLCSAILLISVYGLGKQLFNPTVGLWAAAFCQLIPGLYYYRIEFLLDYPLTAFITLGFWLLTRWYFQEENDIEDQSFLKGKWFAAICFGAAAGLSLMVKQTTIFFLYIPTIWIFIKFIRSQKWLSLLRLLTGLWVSLIIAWPWYSTNWLLILTSGKRASIDSAIAEGDPSLLSLDAWIYYFQVLPYLLSWVLIIIPILALVIYLIQTRPSLSLIKEKLQDPKTVWLLVFLGSGYLLSSININKDARYILPLLPVLSLIIAQCLLLIKNIWWQILPWFTLSLATLLMVYNLFPLNGGNFTQILSPKVQKHPYLETGWPHQKVVEEISNTTPYLEATLGVLPSTPRINQHNFSLFGGLNGFQVYGRQVGVRENEVIQDKRSLDWFLTMTGDQGSVPSAQAKIVELVENSPEFSLHRSWTLPDQNTLKIYHQTNPLVSVIPLDQPQDQVKLDEIIVPETAPPGFPIPVTYRWSGSGEQLEQGIVLLTWVQDLENPQNISHYYHSWLHDHGLGMGRLRFNSSQKTYQVIERTAMLPDPGVSLGNYHLEALYLNRKTGETYPLDVPPVHLEISLTAPILEAPELDLVTQFRTVAHGLQYGSQELEPIFTQTARVNQYDPNQDYLKQTEKALEYRLKSDDSPEEKRIWAYELTLARVLQQDLKGAIAALEQVIALDPDRPYAYAYLAFCHLYRWDTQAAAKALQPALTIAPNAVEVQAMEGAIALLQGNFLKAWLLLSRLEI